MFVIVWEYQVRPEHAAEFERIYSPEGAWAELFRTAAGYCNTELLRGVNDPYHYITIDRWVSVQAYEAFLSESQERYVALDAQCEGLSEREILLGKWESRSAEPR